MVRAARGRHWQIDPCQKLAEFHAALQRATDPNARAVLTELRDE
jgi:hypothetical protein